ncbi:hypothetical protein RSOL_547390, partial [Rhizoctonia solani AG-3 Rhs1AP]
MPPINEAIFYLSKLAPSTEAKASMQTALLNILDWDRAREQTEWALLVQLALQAQYCAKVRAQLAAKGQGPGRSGWLIGNGLPAVLTLVGFHARVVEQNEAAQQERERKEVVAKAKQEHKQRMDQWKKVNNKHIERNKERSNEWKAAVSAWEVEQDLAKIEKCPQGWNKPPKPKPQKAAPKPVLILLCLPGDSESDEVDKIDKINELESDNGKWCT